MMVWKIHFLSNTAILCIHARLSEGYMTHISNRKWQQRPPEFQKHLLPTWNLENLFIQTEAHSVGQTSLKPRVFCMVDDTQTWKVEEQLDFCDMFVLYILLPRVSCTFLSHFPHPKRNKAMVRGLCWHTGWFWQDKKNNRGWPNSLC